MINTIVISFFSSLDNDSSTFSFGDFILIFIISSLVIGSAVAFVGKIMELFSDTITEKQRSENVQAIGWTIALSLLWIVWAPFFLIGFIFKLIRERKSIRDFWFSGKIELIKKNDDLQSKLTKLEWDYKEALNKLQNIKSEPTKSVFLENSKTLDYLENSIATKKEELKTLNTKIETACKNLGIVKDYKKIIDKTIEATHSFAILDSRISDFNRFLSQKNEYEIVVHKPFDFKRMGKALDISPKHIQSLTVTASILPDGAAEPYTTTLTSCTCPDFQNRHVVCKHMYALALYMGTVSCKDKTEFKEQLAEMCEKAELITIERKGIDHLIRAKSQEFPMLSAMFAEFYKEYDDILAYRMATKKPAALKSSEAISIISKEKTKFIERAKRSENLLTYLYANVPWLEEYSSLPPFRETLKPDATIEAGEDVEYASMKLWLSRDEYLKLSVTERNQLALDRYINRSNKTNWDVGIEYEQYIGYLCETAGGIVQYRGAIDGLDDMGRDLIVEKENVVYIIQCKRWHESKTIHEKHIFQLFGSVTEYKYEHPDTECVGVFVTSSALSQRAKDMADILGINVNENVLFKSEYPRIKCNISGNGKIYHLPFDQQYNTVKIKPELGEVYALTVAEAESLGFRRAMRHIVRN